MDEGGTVEFTITLGRALVAGEIIDVPLIIYSTNITTADWSLTAKTMPPPTPASLLLVKLLSHQSCAFLEPMQKPPPSHSPPHRTIPPKPETPQCSPSHRPNDATANGFDLNTRMTNVGGAADPATDVANNTFNATINDNAAPVIGSDAAVSVAEGTTAVLTVMATDPTQAGTTLTYPVTAGTDSERFSIDQSSRTLTFKTAPDFEALGSTNNSNVYEVEITASDGTNSAMQTITVTVTDDPADDILSFSEADDATVIFPNPSGRYLEVQFPVGGTFQILSLSGKPLLESPMNTKVDITYLQSGLYLVQLTDGRLLRFVRE
ncbi:MAG: cadherin domain-containing protein [Ekhidna sp.]|nr:cadherin domain-containing protein [Ekhidna sp.]